MGTADYGQPTDPLSTPSLSQWAEAVHLDSLDTDSEQAAQDARLDVLEAERSLGDLDDVNVTDLPPADGDRLAWSDALGQWQPQPEPPLRYGEWEEAATWAALPASGNWPGRTVHVLDGLGLCLAVWDGSAWRVDAQSDTGTRNVTPRAEFTDALGSATLSAFWVARRGGTVHLHLRTSSGSDFPSASKRLFLWDIPSGWRTGVYSPLRRSRAGEQPDPSSSSRTPASITRIGSRSSRMVRGQRASINGSASWPTSDPWPTTPPA